MIMFMRHRGRTFLLLLAMTEMARSKAELPLSLQELTAMSSSI